MRIGIFSLAYAPFFGGAEVAVKEITDRMPGEFFCITRRFDNQWPVRERIGNVEVLRVGRGVEGDGSSTADYYGRFWEKLAYIFRAWRAAECEHRKNKFTAIWAMMASYGGLAALLFKIRHPSIPMLLTLQEGDSERHILSRVGLFYPLWKLIFKKADYVQAISGYLADFARRHGATCSIEVVPNGVDLEKFKVESLKLKVSDKNSKVIITISRLVPKNGIDILIRAIAIIARLRDDIKLQILGGGPDEQKLKNLAVELGIADKIEFLGHIEPDRIPDYLARSDIFVRVSRSEGLGNSFLEAMATGLPIIGTPVGGIPDFLKDGETGIFAKVDDPNDLAEKISLLLQDEKLRKKLSENGRGLVIENYSWNRIADKMANIFGLLNAIRYTLNPIKILLATGIYPPEIGGPATYAALLEKELPRLGMPVVVLPFRTVRQYPFGIRHFIYFLKSVRQALRSNLVFAQDTISVGFPAILAAKITGRPFVIRVPGDYVWEQSVQRFGVKDGIDEFQNKKYGWRIELMRTIQKFVVGNADVVITPSKYFQELVGGWIKHPEKVHVIYNGIELENQELRIRNYENKRKTIISAGRLVPWKGFDVLIEIMNDLPDWHLEIVGDGPEREALELKVKSLKLEGRVKLIGQIPREDLLKRLREAGVFALNTSFESFSFQVVEAMYVGTPVITTNIGNLSEIVENNKEGILVKPNNKKEILAAIHKIDSDPEFCEIIINNAKKKAEHFSIENTVDQLAKVLSTL